MKENTALADILKERECALICGPFLLRWNEDEMLGCWEIYERKPGHFGERRLLQDIEESEIADAFLRLTSGLATLDAR